MKTQPYIVMVEAEEVVAEITSFRLELLGYKVDVAYRGEELLALLQQRKPDLFIIDVLLPGTSGLALIEQVTVDEGNGPIPVLAISFDAEIDQVQQAFAAGASDYLVAPFDPLVLEAKVSALLESKLSLRHRNSLAKV